MRKAPSVPLVVLPREPLNSAQQAHVSVLSLDLRGLQAAPKPTAPIRKSLSF